MKLVSEISDRVGMQRYDDCNDRDRYFNSVTWANYVSLICCPTIMDDMSRIGYVDLDQDSVRDLVKQLQEWLDKCGEKAR